MRAMKITFIIPQIGITGGVKAIFEIANNLQQRGHDVSVVYPLIPIDLKMNWRNLPKLVSKAIHIMTNFKSSACVDWFNLKANLIKTPTLAQRFIPDADIVATTWWKTAYHVANYAPNKGEKFYFIQHYEIWGGPEERVNNTYKLGLHNIVNSTWLKNILQEKLGAPVEAVILHAPDWEQFYSEDIARSNDTVRILMPYRRIKWKGIADGIKAFEMAREKLLNIQLVMFGESPGKDVPRYVEFHETPDNNELRKIYNSCDLLLFPSHCEGFGMPPMEAMACRRAVVTTNVGGIPDYTIPGETALVSPPHSPELRAENIIKLVEDKELLRRISEGGYNQVRNFTWDKTTDALEQIFNQALASRRSTEFRK